MTNIDSPEMERFQDEAHRALFKASGQKSERSRFIQFLYVLSRDHVAIGKLGEALFRTFMPGDDEAHAWAHKSFAEHPDWFVDPVRLVDEPNPNHKLFLVHLSLLCRDGKMEGLPHALSATLTQTPAADDVEAFISNGWTLMYHRFIADSLQHGLARAADLALDRLPS